MREGRKDEGGMKGEREEGGAKIEFSGWGRKIRYLQLFSSGLKKIHVSYRHRGVTQINYLNDSVEVPFSDVLLRAPSRFHSLCGGVDHGLEQGRGQCGTWRHQSVQWL